MSDVTPTPEETVPAAPTPAVEPDAKGRFYATGRRKSSVARVWIKPGSGEILVNGLSPEDYFKRATATMIVRQPLDVTRQLGHLDIFATVNGGGLSGQAGALRLGIARALVQSNTEYRPLLRREGMLTRDARVVERKKYGQHKARKKHQFSKR